VRLMGSGAFLRVAPAQARSWRWPPELLPLSNERQPFLNYSDEAITQYLLFLTKHPEAYGRLGRFVRMQLGQAQPCPAQFIFREAHIDINEADADLADFLLIRGFEPDHFLTLNPSEYTKCFTARFEIPIEHSDRSRYIAKYLAQVMHEAESKVLEKEGRFAYSEIECYTHLDKRSFEFVPIKQQGIDAFPFRKGEFEIVGDYPKKCDVHLKVPTLAKGEKFRKSESSPMLKLRQLLLLAGLYEIRSLSGNLIYTLQMANARDARRAFRALANWATEFGGITSIELEACTRFWRSEIDLRGDRFVAPVPKIVGARSSVPRAAIVAK
jgi:hypothetical protein